MTHPTRMVFHVLIVALAVGFASRGAKAQGRDSLDPVTVDSAHYKVLYEDSDVRVLRYDDEPGHVVPLHQHKYPYKVYVVTDATREFLSPDDTGKIKKCQQTGAQAKLFANDELMRPPVTHCEVNTGKTPTHLIIFEFKSQKTTATAAARRPNNSFGRARE
jgi:hypothetical protein